MSDEKSIVRINIEGYGTVEADIACCDESFYYDHRDEISDVIAKLVADVMTLVDPRFKDAKFHPALGFKKVDLVNQTPELDIWPVYDH